MDSMMEENGRVVLTVITEASLEARLITTIESYGVSGYTITDARGKGARGKRSGDWDFERNIRVETICTEDVAERISQALQERFYGDYAMVLYSYDVNVLRPEKF